MSKSYWIETLGCAKNEVDSDKLGFRAASTGLRHAAKLSAADVVVVNTCAFIEAAREESISVVLDAIAVKKPGATVVVTGCMAERYRGELAAALPEVDIIAGFGEDFFAGLSPGDAREVKIGATRRKPRAIPAMDLDAGFDLLNLPVGATKRAYGYLKVAEGCDRKCGFCAIPSFRGAQRSRDFYDLLKEAEVLGAPEIITIAQDLASYGKDLYGKKRLVELLGELNAMVPWVRLLYIYPTELNDELIDAIGSSRVNYFDLSLQHVSPTLLRRMRRVGSAEKYLERIASIRASYPEAVFRSNFIVGYPGETEEDHDLLLEFLREARLDWVGFFAFSDEVGTFAHSLDAHLDAGLVTERLGEASEVADPIIAAKRAAQVGRSLEVLIQSPGVARSYMESPEIDGIIQVPKDLVTGKLYTVNVRDCDGIDLIASLSEKAS